MEQHVLARRESLARRSVRQRVKQVQPLLVGPEHLCPDHERLERRRLVQIADVPLDGVGAVARFEVRRVETDVAQEGIGRVAEDLAVARLGHVAVVVDPGRIDRRLEQAKRLPRVELLALARSRLEQAALVLAEDLPRGVPPGAQGLE